MTAAPEFIKPTDQAASEDKLEVIRAHARRARDIELELVSIEERQKALKNELNALYSKTLVDALDEVHLDKLGLAPEGNLPAYDFSLQKFYSANIAAGWDSEKRKAAFDYLEEIGEGDLIKTEIGVPFPREARKDAVAFQQELMARGLQPVTKEGVHQQTLTAWLKDQIEKQGFTPDLTKIGGTIGRVVRMKERKS